MSAKRQRDSATTHGSCFSVLPRVHLIAPRAGVKRQRYARWDLCQGGLGLCFSLQHAFCTHLHPQMIVPTTRKAPRSWKSRIFSKRLQMGRAQYSATLPPMHKCQQGDDWAALHWRTCCHHSFWTVGQERFGFPTAMLGMPLGELSLVAVTISWSPAHQGSGRDTCSGRSQHLCWK